MQKKIKQAQKYLEWEEPNQAIAELRTVLKSNEIQKEYRWVPNHMMGIALSLKGDHASSMRYLEKAIKLGSGQPETYHMLSVNYYNLGKFEEAEKYGNEAVQRKEDLLKGWLNLGSVYRAQAKLEEALQCYQKANRLDPKNSGVAFRIGEIYRDQGDLEQALKLFDITLKIEKDHKHAILEKAEVYKKQGNYEKALRCIGEAKERHSTQTPIQVSEAELYKSQGDYDKAIDLYEQLLEEEPRNGILRVNYALCLQEVSRFEQSQKHYRRAIEDMADPKKAISNYLMGLHYNPENSREYIFKEHVRLGREFIPEEDRAITVLPNTEKDKQLKIGFVSGGFRRHPVGWMIAGALEQLTEDRFELYCYTTNNKYDFVTRRIHQNIDTWRSVVGYNPDVIENLIREDELDILVDLSGHSADNCLDVMSRKPAPIIVKWVGGLFNTSGLEAFDYLISDWHESPEGEEPYYTEKLVRLPDDYITFTPPAYAPEVGELPAEKNGYITFGCFNNPTKVNEVVLKQWAGIMQEIPGSRLFLKSKQYDTPSFKDQITMVMAEEGISGDRIEFQGHTSHDEHLAAYNSLDIALDPWPYSGGLTTCEALYMGVPVVTMPGPTFAGRHSTTHLVNAGLQQWVTDSWVEYTEKVVALAKDRDTLGATRQRLREQILHSPVCDGKRFGAHLSVAFRRMWEQWVDGYTNGLEEWQDHIEIEPLSQEEIEQLTDGPDTTPLIMIKEDDANKAIREEEANDFQPQDKDLQQPVATEEMMTKTAVNGQQAHQQRNGRQQDMTCHQDKTYYIKTKDDVTICTPADLEMLTPYVLLEQEQWFEPELDFIRQYLQPGMQVVDAGASFGAFTLPMAKKVGGEGAVYAFEPGAVARRHLEMSKSENGFHQLEIIERALGQEIGKGRLTNAESSEFNTIDEDGEEDISVTTLDAWWTFAGQPDIEFVKIDVNGMETEVLQGASKTLEAAHPVVLASIGESDESFAGLRDQLTEMNYVVYEYIPGPALLAEHDPEAGVDPYLMNIVAIKENRIKEFKESGWIFDQEATPEQPEKTVWKKTLSISPWTDSLMDDWEEKISSGAQEEYMKALNMICAAEQMDTSAGNAHSRSRKGATMLAAAQQLIGLFNSGKAGVSVAMTYVRVMNQLGKRTQAVEMIKELMETVNSGNKVEPLLPFLPPLPEQDDTDIQTDFSKWLTVRVVEAWIILKDPSTYMSGEQEKKMLKALEGNPEVTAWINRRLGLVVLKQKLNLTEQQFKKIEKSLGNNANLLHRKEKKNDRSLISNGYTNEFDNSFDSGTPLRIIPRKFWQTPTSRKKANIAVAIADKLQNGELADHREKIVRECQDRIDRDGTDSMAFYIMVHALQSIDYHDSIKIDSELIHQLHEKGWESKKTLYSYFYNYKEVFDSIRVPELSVIVVSNKMNTEVLKNLKEIHRQRDKKTEVIFVNNGLSEGATKKINKYVDVLIHLKQNAGACLARNFGALFSEGSYLLFIDDDGIPEEGLLQAHKRIYARRDAYVARGVYLPKNKGGKTPWHYYLGSETKPAVCFLEGNTSFRSTPFFDIDGWQDSLLVYHEGMELSYRYYSRGYEREKLIYFPDAVLRHDYIKPPAGQNRKNKLLKTSYHLVHAMYDNLDNVIYSWPEKFTSNTKATKTINDSEYSALKKVSYLAPGNADMAYGLHNKRAAILAEKTRNEGVKSEILYLTDPLFLEKIVQISKEPGHAIHSGIMGYPSWVMIDRVQSANLFDLLNVDIFAMLGDHLFADFMWQRLKKMGSKTIFYSQDQAILDELDVLGPGTNPSFTIDFFPPVTEVDEEKAQKKLEKREIDVLIPWALNAGYADSALILQEISKLDENIVSVGEVLMGEMKSIYDQSVLSVFKECYASVVGGTYQFSREKTEEDYRWMKMLHLVDQYVRHRRRFDMLQQLSDLSSDKFNIVITADKKQANGYNKLHSKSSIQWIGQVTAEHLDRLYADSKIVLNCNPTYPDYLHGRVKSGMRWGCCVITDRIPGLSKRFNNKEHLLFVDKETNLGELLQSERIDFQEIADSGKKVMDSRYTQEGSCRLLLRKMNTKLQNK
ncbi:methyltransferase, FkbM family [Fodinibius roseus]|uniref:protein O-GlcNAc transferase n=1 Tax=Fodinibius roseus TaxID=1194090 RepID=A0A1M5GME4_9BACT|nr:FkbM family methyltransferase [Fodinibius roseus]SHG04672.1 methyltransferase, FkbM family [Fodinibius roseus]